MGIGPNVAVEEAEDEYRNKAANAIAEHAAALVASGNCSREEAVEKITEWMRLENEADQDVNGVLAAEIKFPAPKNNPSAAQIAAIKKELLPAARMASKKN